MPTLGWRPVQATTMKNRLDEVLQTPGQPVCFFGTSFFLACGLPKSISLDWLTYVRRLVAHAIGPIFFIDNFSTLFPLAGVL
jgi:hypothetical protein